MKYVGLGLLLLVTTFIQAEDRIVTLFDRQTLNTTDLRDYFDPDTKLIVYVSEVEISDLRITAAQLKSLVIFANKVNITGTMDIDFSTPVASLTMSQAAIVGTPGSSPKKPTDHDLWADGFAQKSTCTLSPVDWYKRCLEKISAYDNNNIRIAGCFALSTCFLTIGEKADIRLANHSTIFNDPTYRPEPSPLVGNCCKRKYLRLNHATGNFLSFNQVTLPTRTKERIRKKVVDNITNYMLWQLINFNIITDDKTFAEPEAMEGAFYFTKVDYALTRPTNLYFLNHFLTWALGFLESAEFTKDEKVRYAAFDIQGHDAVKAVNNYINGVLGQVFQLMEKHQDAYYLKCMDLFENIFKIGFDDQLLKEDYIEAEYDELRMKMTQTPPVPDPFPEKTAFLSKVAARFDAPSNALNKLFIFRQRGFFEELFVPNYFSHTMKDARFVRDFLSKLLDGHTSIELYGDFLTKYDQYLLKKYSDARQPGGVVNYKTLFNVYEQIFKYTTFNPQAVPASEADRLSFNRKNLVDLAGNIENILVMRSLPVTNIEGESLTVDIFSVGNPGSYFIFPQVATVNPIIQEGRQYIASLNNYNSNGATHNDFRFFLQLSADEVADSLIKGTLMAGGDKLVEFPWDKFIFGEPVLSVTEVAKPWFYAKSCKLAIEGQTLGKSELEVHLDIRPQYFNDFKQQLFSNHFLTVSIPWRFKDNVGTLLLPISLARFSSFYNLSLSDENALNNNNATLNISFQKVICQDSLKNLPAAVTIGAHQLQPMNWCSRIKLLPAYIAYSPVNANADAAAAANIISIDNSTVNSLYQFRFENLVPVTCVDPAEIYSYAEMRVTDKSSNKLIRTFELSAHTQLNKQMNFSFFSVMEEIEVEIVAIQHIKRLTALGEYVDATLPPIAKIVHLSRQNERRIFDFALSCNGLDEN